MTHIDCFLACTNRFFCLKMLCVCTGIVMCSAQSIAATQQHDTNQNSNSSTIDHSKHRSQLRYANQQSRVITVNALSLPNVLLLNEQGEEIAVFDDLIKNKIVIMNTIFTTCTTVCPVMGVQFARLQKVLQRQFGTEKLAQDILLVSVSIDPINDTPQRLHAWKEKFHGGPGWTLLTGPKSDVDELLKAAGLFTPDPEEHTPITLVGSAKQNQWVRVSGLGPLDQIVKLVSRLITANDS